MIARATGIDTRASSGGRMAAVNVPKTISRMSSAIGSTVASARSASPSVMIQFVVDGELIGQVSVRRTCCTSPGE
jgi:hypothetical protein